MIAYRFVGIVGRSFIEHPCQEVCRGNRMVVSCKVRHLRLVSPWTCVASYRNFLTCRQSRSGPTYTWIRSSCLLDDGRAEAGSGFQRHDLQCQQFRLQTRATQSQTWSSVLKCQPCGDVLTEDPAAGTQGPHCGGETRYLTGTEYCSIIRQILAAIEVEKLQQSVMDCQVILSDH